jgi:hypothetical protein
VEREDITPAAPLVCARLRHKGGGVRYGERLEFDSGFISNAVFWCVDTGEPVGPDDGFAHPHVCLAGRECYCESSRDHALWS